MRKLTRLDLFAASAMIAAIVAAPSAQAEEIEQVRDVSGFDGVSINGSSDVIITVGEDFRVVVYADDEVMEDIVTEVFGGELRIGRERGSRRSRGRRGDVRVEVSMPRMDSFDTNGSGDAWITGLDAPSFRFDANGSGDTEISGTCGDGNFDMNGSGELEAEDLICESADIDTNGSGDVELTVTGTVEIDSHGSGDITLYGSPRISRMRSRGSGEVEIK